MEDSGATTKRMGLGVLLVAFTVATLLVLDYWVIAGAFWWTERAGWPYVLALAPTFLMAFAVGWIVGKLTAREFAFVVGWSTVLFLVLRVGYTMGGWFHGGWWTHVFSVVLLPLAPALGFWLGARRASRTGAG